MYVLIVDFHGFNVGKYTIHVKYTNVQGMFGGFSKVVKHQNSKAIRAPPCLIPMIAILKYIAPLFSINQSINPSNQLTIPESTHKHIYVYNYILSFCN